MTDRHDYTVISIIRQDVCWELSNRLWDCRGHGCSFRLTAEGVTDCIAKLLSSSVLTKSFTRAEYQVTERLLSRQLFWLRAYWKNTVAFSMRIWLHSRCPLLVVLRNSGLRDSFLSVGQILLLWINQWLLSTPTCLSQFVSVSTLNNDAFDSIDDALL